MSALPQPAELPTPAPTPRLHLRLLRQAVPAPQRLTGKGVARLALELALKLPLLEALTCGIRQLADPAEHGDEQVARIAGLSMKLITEGLRVDDAVSIALHEPAHLRPHAPLPDVFKTQLFPERLTGEHVLKLAHELNHNGVKMDDAIVAALRKAAAPRAVSVEQGKQVLEAAHRLFKGGAQVAQAFELALRQTLTAPASR